MIKEDRTGAVWVSVWDPFVRIFHWSLAGLVAWAVFSGLFLPPTWLRSHIVAGTAALGFVGVRLLWGILGSTYARFGSFVADRQALLHHVGELLSERSKRHLGHNPLGGLMVFALLLVVVLLALTGTTALGGSLKTGPLGFATRFAVGETALGIHQWLAYLLIGLILLHAGGVAFESWRSGENLVSAMVHGRKRRRPGDRVAAHRRAYPVAALLLSVAGLTMFAVLIAALSALHGLGVPAQPLDLLYVEECGACHTPFHPSLAPAIVWSTVMDRLEEHFGEDASLDPASADRIRGFLLTNNAEIFDTRPANRLRFNNPADPLRITATSFWQQAHSGIADKTFAAKVIGGRTACGACHPDAATGLFYPTLIHIPEVVER